MITGYSDTLIWKVIYAWHMPMFFFLAGITLYLGIPSKEKITLGLIWIKFKRLIIPTFVWNIIIYLMKDFWFVGIQPFITFPDNLAYCLMKLVFLPTYVIWFLYVLFVYTMIVFFVKKFIKERYQILFILLLFPILYIFRTSLFGLSYIGNYYIYFAVGYLFSKYNLLKKYSLLTKISFVFLICVFFTACISYIMNVDIIIKVAGLLKTIFLAFAIILIMWICVEKIINAVPKVIKETLIFFGKKFVTILFMPMYMFKHWNWRGYGKNNKYFYYYHSNNKLFSINNFKIQIYKSSIIWLFLKYLGLRGGLIK